MCDDERKRIDMYSIVVNIVAKVYYKVYSKVCPNSCKYYVRTIKWLIGQRIRYKFLRGLRLTQ